MIKLIEMHGEPVQGGEVEDGVALVTWMYPGLIAAAHGMVSAELIYAHLNLLLMPEAMKSAIEVLH